MIGFLASVADAVADAVTGRRAAQTRRAVAGLRLTTEIAEAVGRGSPPDEDAYRRAARLLEIDRDDALTSMFGEKGMGRVAHDR